MNANTHTKLPQSAMRRLLNARKVVVLTGAGMSAESGIPTFRDAQTGLWAKFRPEDLATPAAFDRHPRRVWDWYAWRREAVARAKPHAGYRALVALAKFFAEFRLVTQNVDGLHQAAGAADVIELHGNIMRTVCSITGQLIDDTWLAGSNQRPPPSPHAEGGLARPDVVWFGEALPVESLNRAMDAASQAEVMLSVGTSAMVQPAASLPLVALEAGALLIEINPDPTPLSPRAHHCLRLPAGIALPAIASACRTAGTS